MARSCVIVGPRARLFTACAGELAFTRGIIIVMAAVSLARASLQLVPASFTSSYATSPPVFGFLCLRFGIWYLSSSLFIYLLKSLCGGGVPSSHPSLGLSVYFLSLRAPSLLLIIQTDGHLLQPHEHDMHTPAPHRTPHPRAPPASPGLEGEGKMEQPEGEAEQNTYGRLKSWCVS